MFVVGVEFASRPDDGETTWVHLEAFLLGFAGAAIGSCTAIVGLATASRRVALSGAGGVAVGAAIFMVTLESQSPRDEEIEYWRGLFVLALGLAVAAALVASRLRAPTPGDVRAR